MASEVMLAPTAAPGTSRREIDDVRDMVRNATVTTVYVSYEIRYDTLLRLNVIQDTRDALIFTCPLGLR